MEISRVRSTSFSAKLQRTLPDLRKRRVRAPRGKLHGVNDMRMLFCFFSKNRSPLELHVSDPGPWAASSSMFLYGSGSDTIESLGVSIRTPKSLFSRYLNMFETKRTWTWLVGWSPVSTFSIIYIHLLQELVNRKQLRFLAAVDR